MNEINQAVFYFLYRLPRQDADVYAWVIYLADGLPYLVVLLALGFILFHREFLRNPFIVAIRKMREIIFVFGATLAAYVISKILKVAINAARPFDALPDVTSLFAQTGHAFPSGHATFFAALAFSIFFISKKAGYVFMLFALIIGTTRIMAGVHFPLDILGGFLLGALVAYLFKKYKIALQ